MVVTDSNEKISFFSRSSILHKGLQIINIKDEKLNNYIWWKGLLKPIEIFNPEKTKGFLVLRLLLYGYLNRITTCRSNSDNALMYPYLKILLDDEEIYRTKILNSSINVWDEKIEIQIHYIKSKIEIQLYDLDETDGVVEDEYIGSAIINIFDLKLSKKYDIIIKYINKKGILTNPHIFKSCMNEDNEKEKKSDKQKNDEHFTDSKKNRIKDTGTNVTLKKSKNISDYNIRIFAKLVNKYHFNNIVSELNNITSINYKFIKKKNEILENDLNVNKLYEDIKYIKFNFDTIWLPFFLIIYNFASWQNPFCSIFFVFFLCFSIIFSKFFLSFFLFSLSLVIFVFVSIIKDSDDKLKLKNLSLLKRKNVKRMGFQKHTKKKNKYHCDAIRTLHKNEKISSNWKNKKDSFSSLESDLTDEDTSTNISSSSSSSNSSIDSYSDVRTNSSSFQTINKMSNREKKNSPTFTQKGAKQNRKKINDFATNNESEATKEDGTEEKDEEEEGEEEEEEEEDDDEDDDEDDEEETEGNVIETDLTVIKTFISNIIDDEVICSVKYIHFILSSLIQLTQNMLDIFRKFGYLLVVLSWFLCILNIFFFIIVTKLLRFLFF